MSMNENCWPLTGKNEGAFCWGKLRRRFTTGSPVRVSFDRQYVYDLEDEKKELPPKERPVVGFYHTHPGFTATPSFIDHSTMGAWVNCLGKNLWCVIKGLDGFRAFLYQNDESYPLESCKCIKANGILIIDTVNLKDYGYKEENDNVLEDGLPLLVPRSQVVEDGYGLEDFQCPYEHGEVNMATGICKKCGWSAISLMDD